ncbi:10032_t:CDS:2, partial [Entrophospora sp. SA101]
MQIQEKFVEEYNCGYTAIEKLEKSIKGISEAKVEKILRDLNQQQKSKKKRHKLVYITTGSGQLNNILGSNERFLMVELKQAQQLKLFGEFRTRKSQLCHTLVIFAVLIVDSVTALYRTDYAGRGELAACQMHLAKFLLSLQCLADEVYMCVLFVATVDGNMTMFDGQTKEPVGGNITSTT